ncbi:bacteriohopanetetrol glucosamine biosynthesis glycosyltransferase HpnI [Acetobacter oeni]|uniref:Glucosyltransferase n=1 Tax=Acetobacter oeni TaxID=304077 RepID=A0A511XLG5_9PROT|nr:bacteriohopanetetrol glucosamine biosynthesis glycosyltransferase HpnI [Acetobacter oeni]MBB3883577.1 ceramide glucosyltransferase [Acetobacter oeni]NHO19686.1 glycosyltransferase [Acetobacter oeni]GBR04201.1 ceramide glucosyltransferase [Acetobacter oeni LMG 21952]GEN63782.1 glucosyltransferase [Acetobacter oeni]
MLPVFSLSAVACTLLGVTGCIQAALGTILVARFCARERKCQSEPGLPPVTILKPLHGDEPLLEQALESFCTLNYPVFQIVFGVQRANDPAICLVERLKARHPGIEMSLVVNGAMHGENRKVSNLINMLPTAKHDILVVSDSDIHVGPDYLRQVVASLKKPDTGLVTTLYAGLPATNTFPRLLAACQINHNFLPGVLLSRYLGRQDCLGATMALTRTVLAEVGGFEALVDHVADDAVLGRLVRARGENIGIAGCMTWTTIGEKTFADLLSHELRWGRTVRALAPGGYLASSIQLPLFWLTAAVSLQPHAVWPLVTFVCGWIFRAICAFVMDRTVGQRSLLPLLMLPFRDWLSAAIMMGSMTGTRVDWRGHTMHVAPHIPQPQTPVSPLVTPLPHAERH